MPKKIKCAVAGLVAGTLNGFFGAGGGMLLVPLLIRWVKLDERRAFATSVFIILPLCIVSGTVYILRAGINCALAVPYLIGGLVGGFIGGRIFKRIPTALLHRIFGLLLIYGGVRSLFGLTAVAGTATAVLSALAGLAAGVLSAWGVGGGSLLILYMTLIAGLSQQTAQGINLLYFLPTSLSALTSHFKNKLVEVKAAVPAIVAGVVSALGVSYLATGLDTAVLKKIFGVFIILVGLSEVLGKAKKAE